MEGKTFSGPALDKQLKGHRNGITAVHFSPNEQQLASSSLDHSVLLWDLRGTMRSYRFQGHEEAVMDVTFSPTGKYMASASRDKTVRLWVPTVTGSTGMFKAHSQTVRSVQFSPDSCKILTASDDKIVKLWSSEKQKFIASFVGHNNWVRCARISNDGSVIASCSDDKTTRLWNPDDSKCIHTYKDQNGHGVCLAWHPSGCYIAVGTSHGNVKLYDIRTHNLVQYYSIHDEAVMRLAFHPSGSYIVTASKDGKVKILDLLEGHPIFTLGGHIGGVNAVGFSPSGDTFATAGDDKFVFIWSTNFTEQQNDNENVPQNAASVQRSTSQSKFNTMKDKNQATPVWNQCYHSMKYPVTTFVHLDDASDGPRNGIRESIIEGMPAANSTIHDGFTHSVRTDSNRPLAPPFSTSPRISSNVHSESRSTPRSAVFRDFEFSSFSVGHTSHIPRRPPTPMTYSIPSFADKSVDVSRTGCDTEADDDDEEGMFGMINLKENDVCYTSGKIEWVGKKRSFPINSGFKVVTKPGSIRPGKAPSEKKARRFDQTYSVGTSSMKGCDCADVLPTVNAIVDHLNALHEAVDIVDLRLSNIEDPNPRSCN